uniref:Uncharacterized protein n=1 Tax=Arundo donax TaxID=35708 RepID=A0A0A9E8B0_ARUDO
MIVFRLSHIFGYLHAQMLIRHSHCAALLVVPLV